jgi:hypothetical protein
MKKFIAAFLVLVAAVAAALIYFTLTKPAPRATDLLPESTLVFVDIPDFSKSRADFANTELYALWQEPDVQTFLEKPLAALREASANAGASDAANIGKLIFNAMQGEVFLALTHVTLFPSFNPGLIVGADVRHNRIEVAAGLYKLEAWLKRAYPHGNFQDKKYLGVKYSIWETQPGVPICHAFFDSLVVLTYNEDTMRDVIACYTGQVPPDFKRLAASAKFKNVERHASNNHEFLAYLNVEELMGLVGPLLALSPQTSGLYQKLGRIQTSAVSMSFVDRGVEDVAFVAYSNPEPKPTPPTQRKTLALTSPDTLLYSVHSVDLATAYEEGMQSLSQSGNAALMATVEQFQQTLRARGIHVREDVLQKLDPELAAIASWRSGTRAPDVAIVGAITDVEKLRPALDGVMNALKESALGDDEKTPWDETESAGWKLRTIRIGTGLIAPTYTTTDQFFILASTPDYARELLAQVRESKPTLATSATYQQSMKRLPMDGSSYGYADLRGLFEPLYGLAKWGLSQIGTNEFVDAGKLPRSETIAKHLFPFVSATVCERQQAASTSFSPFGKSMAIVAGVGCGIWAANTFGSQLLPAATPALKKYSGPALPRKSSSRGVPSAPDENQTGASQTPATR